MQKGVDKVMDVKTLEIDKADMERRIFTEKKQVTTTIPIGIKEWLDDKRADVNELLIVGFRHLMDMREQNKRLNDLEEKIVRMEENIQKYQKRVAQMYLKFEDLKKQFKLPEDVSI